ncbi:hypothetical protein [Lewinella sp. W8]|uniref:hypothetical protein n=1 Tax=Lewinella sp. W8 TaxID=2528208 RepID=UPI001067488B|nr:hypothetical protein [Lewinella sp. W8]MTB53002.1 hypothetical protein [Lewinella sp. W8]
MYFVFSLCWRVVGLDVFGNLTEPEQVGPGQTVYSCVPLDAVGMAADKFFHVHQFVSHPGDDPPEIDCDRVRVTVEDGKTVGKVLVMLLAKLLAEAGLRVLRPVDSLTAVAWISIPHYTARLKRST